MRLFIIFAAIFIFMPVTALASEQHLSRHYTIRIEVESIEAAREIINELNGYNLDSSAYFRDSQRIATFTRRVDDWAFRHVQEFLRGLGEVIEERENAYFVGAEIMNLNTQISVLSGEMERLSVILSASDTLSVLLTVNDRMSTVSRNRDALVGRRNVLLSETSTAVINIQLVEPPEEPEKPIPVTFGERVSDAFMNSLQTTLRIAGDVLVWFVGSIIPILIWGVIGGLVGVVVHKTRKKRRVVIEEVNHETE